MRIWFNRTFATHTHTIALLRGNPDGEPVWVLGSHTDPDSPVLGACDETFIEPELQGEAYVQWALEVCERYAIDVFVPRLNLELFAHARERFTAAGVAVVVTSPGSLALLDDKAAAYEDARAAGLFVPPYRVADSPESLWDAFEEILKVDGSVCMKPVSGVGATGFHVLQDGPLSWEQVAGAEPYATPVAEVVASMGRARDAGASLPQMMVMPVLTGPEVSVDCLGDTDGNLLAAVARVERGRRYSIGDETSEQVAATVVARHRLASLTNTQVRYWQHPGVDDAPRPYLLETNTRMAGGIFQSALSGVNLPWAGVLQALGRPVGDLQVRRGGEFGKVSGICELGPSPA